CKLLDKFKKEAGSFNPNEREIPFLPGKKLFGRSQISTVALERMNQLNAYSKRLIRLKKEISCCELVLRFFELNQNDIHSLTQTNSNEFPAQISLPTKNEEYKCIHDFKAMTKNEISIRKNQIVKVLEKNFNGWWFIDSSDGQGFVPQSILSPLNNSNEDKLALPVDENEIFIINKDFKADKSDEISLKKGDYIRVLEKRLNGWWMVEYQNKVGFAPAVCINKEVQKNSDSKSVLSFASFDSLGDSIDSKKPNPIPKDDFYYVIQDYEDPLNEGISLKMGQKCCVLNTENESGWWYLTIEGTNLEGWAPSAFLTKHKLKPPRPPPPKKAITHENTCKNFSAKEEITSVSKLREIILSKNLNIPRINVGCSSKE
ncbi:SH3 and PX domain-containing 2B, partial [Brachionus plicatilis]